MAPYHQKLMSIYKQQQADKDETEHAVRVYTCEKLPYVLQTDGVGEEQSWDRMYCDETSDCMCVYTMHHVMHDRDVD